MFKPTRFDFDSAVQWPGANSTKEISADNIYKVESDAETYTFVHSSGYAFQIDKSQVTPYGVWTSDDVPNMPDPDSYQDGIESGSNSDSPDTTPDQGDSESTDYTPDPSLSDTDLAPAEPVADQPSGSDELSQPSTEDDSTDTSMDSPPVDPDAGTKDTDAPTVNDPLASYVKTKSKSKSKKK